MNLNAPPLPLSPRLRLPPIALCLHLAASTAIPASAPHNPSPPLSPPLTPSSSSDLREPARWIAVEQGPHHRIWQTKVPPNTQQTTDGDAPSTYVELGTGLNRWDRTQRRWLEAHADFERTPDGYFVALHTQHQAILSPDLNVLGAVDLMTPDERRLRSTILGLALVDGRTGRSVLVAETQMCRAQQVSPTEIVYENAFEGLTADVRYTIAIDRFEQDVILHERIAPEMVSAAGLNPEATRLLVLTEFFDPPTPTKNRRDLLLPHGEKMGDHEIRFGTMTVAAGQAFHAADPAPGLPVTKSWESLEGRQFLVESVHYPSLLPMLQSLPLSPQSRIESLKQRWRRTAFAPPTTTPQTVQSWAAIAPPPRRALASRHDISRPSSLRETERFARDLRPNGPGRRPPSLAEGVVIDYNLTLTSDTNDFTFRADTTYCVRTTLSVGGTAIFEGGTVIKFANSNSPGIVCYGPVRCATAPFLPAIFTSIDDDTVGETLPNSTGNPALGCQADPALQIMRPGQHLHDLRIAHACRGVFFHDYSAGTSSLSHAQFVHCLQALTVNGCGALFHSISLRNLLFDNASVALGGYSFAATGQHLTCHNCPTLATDTQGHIYRTTSTLALINSLLVATGDSGNVALSQTHCASAARSNEVFQTVGAGGFYLARASLRDAGSPAIDPTLAAELHAKTTWPPRIRSGSIASDLLVVPQTPRDVDTPDIGYHYDPIDEAVNNCRLHNGATLRVAADTTLATFGQVGLQLHANTRLLAEGAPGRPVRFCRYQLVQEQSLNWGTYFGTWYAILGPTSPVTNVASAPTADFLFTEFLAPAGLAWHLHSGASYNALQRATLRHSTATGGQLVLLGPPGGTFELGNCLFQRTALRLERTPRFDLWNCLFRAGSVSLDRYANAPPWHVSDCVFDNTTLADTGTLVVNSHNAYVGTAQTQLRSPSGPALTLASFDCATGPFGRCYATATNLVDRGSRPATHAGLFHFTSHTNNLPESTGTVDIGLHYPVAQSTSQPQTATPRDSDQDGVPDTLEDLDGDGAVDSGETDWNNAQDAGLRVRITHPENHQPMP